MTGTTRASAREAAAKLAEHGIEAADAYGRPDLAARLRDLQRLAAEPTVRVLVAGEFKQGKSSLVNALAGTDVCPIDDDIATSVATAVHYAEAPEAFAVFAGEDGTPTRKPVDAGALPSWVTEAGEMAATEGLQLVDVGVPADALRGGLVLVDLPGAGGLGSFHGAATLAALRHAHGVLFVSDAVQELTAAERDFLAAVSQRCATVALVKSKTDIHPAWRRILERDREHAADLATLVTGASAELAAKGRESSDDELVAESGLTELAGWLHDDVLARAGNLLAAAVADEIGGVCEQLRAPFDAERAALEDGTNRAELEARLEAARADADRLRAAASRWQQVMSDSFTDIGSDADHDLRARVRDLVRRNEEAIDGFDPATAWEEYEPVLRREMSSLIAEHDGALHDRVAAAAQRVTDVFEEDAAAVDQAMQALAPSALDAATASSAPALSAPSDLATVKRMGLGGQAFTLVRQSYGPALMLGFIGGIAGLTLAAPALLAVGLVAGGKGLHAEKARRLAARQAQAKASARKFVDEVVFEVSKESRDEIRRTQRALRDHFSARANELLLAANASLKAAQDATGGNAQARDQRRHDITAEVKRIEWLAGVANRMRAAVDGTAP